MPLPTISITFKQKAVSAIKRSRQGVVALILLDDTAAADSFEYQSVEEVNATDWTADNLDYIQKAFIGAPAKVIIERLDTAAFDYTEALTRLNNKRFDYLAIPGILSADTATIVNWIKTKRDDENKVCKAVLPSTDADYEGVINFTTTGIIVGGKEYSTAEYTARIAGILAGLPFTQSCTYYVLPEVTAIDEIADPDAAVDAGELIFINDGEDIKIGRGVNSLVSTGASKTEDWKSIRIVEIMDMIQSDIRTSYNKDFVGKYPNIYDNQVLFITAVNSYLSSLAGEELLDPLYDNRVGVDIAAQRAAWEGIGIDTTDWDDQKVKEMSFKRNVFLTGDIKPIDAMEDLAMVLYM